MNDALAVHPCPIDFFSNCFATAKTVRATKNFANDSNRPPNISHRTSGSRFCRYGYRDGRREKTILGL